MIKTVLHFDSVSFRYPKQEKGPLIYDSMKFTVREGEFVSILGPSGAGKSTLFRLITGLEQPTGGKILLNGEYFSNRLGHVGYMPQQDLLMPWRTIWENAALPLQIKGSKQADMRISVEELLKEFGLGGHEDRYPAELSGGMRQRVSFLRTILTGSQVLLLDEPFSALDAITRLSMQEWLLKQWEKRKKTILFITHDVNEALFLSERIFVLTDPPVSRMEDIPVPLDRPRTLKALDIPEIMVLKDRLIDQLRTKATT
ncbi:ABC transporter ATP-binding protein [Peribacillus glennii]|uniref:ABC transporter ATP-binding protein n=1 Tax=Peribacillus glennii TaxID=2303991 RepID=A0A372L6Z7_9BACI|nr:ABC transporter ATP-binding protein [Peribacillus glennii]RFU60898.1 ABC transporter ATP-binding protein [Peribacillus glennii]